MTPAQLYCWHFMAYPHLAPDFAQTQNTGWVTVPNSLWDSEASRGLYQEYIDQLAYADQLGFDGFVLNEHHQNVYGLAPSPNIIAAALTQATKKGRIVVLGNLLPLHMNPRRVAEEYAMLDMMSGGRIVAGFAPGGGPETFNYDVPSARSREQFWESLDLIVRAWTEDGPFAHEGVHFPLRYVNPWPKTLQKPHPPIWVPGSRSPGTLIECAKRGYCYFLSSRSHGSATGRAKDQFTEILEQHGRRYHPFRMGILLSVYVVAGVICGLAAWSSIGRVGSISPTSFFEANLESITAVVIGGISLFGGRGSILGPLIGALIVGVFNSGLRLAGVDVLWQLFATGWLIIFAVAIDQWIRKVSS